MGTMTLFAKGWIALAGVLGALLVASAAAEAAGAGKADPLDMYQATVDRAQAADLGRDGYDVASVRQTAAGTQVDLVLTTRERDRLRSQGIELALIRNGKGQTVRRQAELQAAAGYSVYRSYDQPGGIRDELYSIAARHPNIVKLEVIGHTLQGREILALKVTKNARTVADGSRPDVLYMGTIHAREWISTEVVRRELHYFVENYNKNADVTDLVNTRELWFMPVSNPDGYQYTFDAERLWRKNLRDNDGDGQISNADGVDLNRNYDISWGYDDEGSSTQISSETYRGTRPASEPEVQAHQALIDRLKFKFLVTYHSYGPLLLYPFGWQIQTETADDPLYVAYTGTDANPAITRSDPSGPEFDPGVAADLYITNGTTDDYSYSKTGALSWTPELEEGCDGCGFVFPDDEAKIQAAYAKNLPFALDLARSAPDPSTPVSHLGSTVKPFYLETSSIDPEKTNNPMSDFRFAVSYGDPQTVRVLAKRSLGAVTLRYQINGGAVQSAPTSEWNGGKRYGGPGDFYYRVMQGQVTGTKPGDSVKVWFVDADNPAVESGSFTYTAKVESANDVLVMSAEDYTGTSPVYKKTNGPTYLSYYLDALAANGIGADVYDVDANGRRAPSQLGVLSHYKAVIWYTGDDVITREPGMVPGTASRLANDEMLAVRAYLNEGGRLLYTGKYAGYEQAFGYEFNIETNAPCNPDSDSDGCQALSDDFLQYYLGAYIYNDDAGATPNGKIYDIFGIDDPFADGLRWSIGTPSAGNQDHSASFIPTSTLLPPAQFPDQPESHISAKYDRAGGPFDPHTGSHYVYSQIGDQSYKRLTRTISVPASGATMSFWTSYNTEVDWDYVMVEAHTVGQDDWTTLPDQNGHTATGTGESCPEGWSDIHPFLAHYQTLNADGSCSPAGTTGSWNAATGASGGWQQWSVDLAAYAGKQVEVSISYVSDWATQGLGDFVDDVVVSTGAGTTSFEDDGDVMDGWAVTGPPAGSAPNPNNFERVAAGGFKEGPVVATPDTLYFGFGFEGVATPASRNALMARAMRYLRP
jgi:zinc carboxypeptidase/immune inhibitor InhA-like protein